MGTPENGDNGMVWVGDIMFHDTLLSQPSETTFFGDDSKNLSDDNFRCHSQMDAESFISLDDFESSRWCSNDLDNGEILTDNDAANCGIAIATQTGVKNVPAPTSRKIKPVEHPALKLQTPIAYQPDTDLNVIPIQKDGRAVCKKCGAIGVKHAFYTRERQFCSLACARAATEGEINEDVQQQSQSSPPAELPHEEMIQSDSNEGFVTNTNRMMHVFPNQHTGIVHNPQPQTFTSQTKLPLELPSVYTLPLDEPVLPADRKVSSELSHSYDWAEQLNDPFFTAAPVTCFKHVPMLEYWNSISTGIKVEVENSDCYDFCEEFPDSFWIATILRVAGYKALLRYEGFIDDNSKDFWINLCSSSVHPVGWCATRGKPLIPPKTIKDKYLDWKDFLVKRLTGARTLPSNFHNKVNESLKSRFRCDLTLEVVDKERISQVKVATIEKICGKRLQLRYFDAKVVNADSFWCHEDSPLIHPVGWSKRVGQALCASPEYHDRITKGLRERDDATEDLFPIISHLPFLHNSMFREGMKLEAIDPLNLGDICIATIMQVLNDGYLMICVDFWNDKNSTRQDWFCYHMTSPCIFPAGFCHANDIPLTPPKGYNRTTFDWNDYLQETGCIAAPPELFAKVIPEHGFNVNMKIEAADLMNPRLVCVATVTRIVGRLLKVHFDGWEDDFDQWVDCESCDIYPVGWCEFVGHKLEPPYAQKLPSVGRSSKKRRYKGTSSHGSNKKTANVGSGPSHYNNLHDHHQRKSNSSTFNTETIRIKNNRSPPPLLPITDVPVNQQNDENHITIKREVFEEKIPHVNNNGDVTNMEQMKQTTNHVNNNNDALSSSPSSNIPLTKESFVNNAKAKFIPNLEDIKKRSGYETIHPETWDHNDITEFLKINGCSAYCDSFWKQKIDGKAFLELSKENVHILTDRKVGPSLKISNLIHQLKYMTTSHSRFVRTTAGKNVL